VDGFVALADPTRRRIVELLGAGECAAGAITAEFAASAPAISQHLKVLREARLVRVRAEGQRRMYSLDPAGWTEIDAWLVRVRRFWTERLDALERELGVPARRRRAPSARRRKR
jgi:DNA-binding transcriptional ArsR family regulator